MNNSPGANRPAWQMPPREQPQATQQPVQQPTTHYGRELSGAVAMFAAAFGIRAARNHHAVDGSMANAANRGIGMMVRIGCWLWVWMMWAVMVLLTLSRADDQPASMFLLLPLEFVGSLGFGVLWCRNSDYGLFRRGPVYRLFLPLAKVADDFPTIAIYAIILGPAFLGMIGWNPQ